MGDAFQVGENHFYPGDPPIGLEEIDLVEVRLVAQAHETGKPHALGKGDIENGCAEGAGLGHEGDLASGRRVFREGGIHGREGMDETQTVGAEDAHVVPPGDICDRVLRDQAFVPRFAETCRYDNHRAYAKGAAGLEGIEDHLCGDGDYREVDGLSDLPGALIGPKAEKLIFAGVYRINFTREAAFDQVKENGVAWFVDTVRCADYGDGSGGDKSFQISVAHDFRDREFKPPPFLIPAFNGLFSGFVFFSDKDGINRKVKTLIMLVLFLN